MYRDNACAAQVVAPDKLSYLSSNFRFFFFFCPIMRMDTRLSREPEWEICIQRKLVYACAQGNDCVKFVKDTNCAGGKTIVFALNRRDEELK